MSSFVDYNYKIRDHRRQTSTAYQFVSPEASYNSPLWGPVANVKWTSTLSPTLLLDTGFSWYYVPWSLDYQPGLADRRAAARRHRQVDADRRAAAVDGARHAGTPHLEQRRLVAAVLGAASTSCGSA